MQLNASYPDGTKRKGFQDLKEAARLECLKVDMPHQKRDGIQKEIDNLKKIR